MATTQTPWAILLCKFSDDPVEPYPRSRYEEIFTSRGQGLWSMPDYFDAMSHGHLDLSGSEVLGWFEIDIEAGDYTDSSEQRDWLIPHARQKAAEAGHDLSPYYSVVVVLNRPSTLFGTLGDPAGGVACGEDGALNHMTGLCPSLMGQEMGHVYGLDHSRIDHDATDYQDPYDVMSTATSGHMAPHPVYGETATDGSAVFRIGPGLNAANMDAQGWLDPDRVDLVPMDLGNTRVHTLRPLHHRELPGSLALRVGSLYVEFRVREAWDADIEQPMVLLHTFEHGHSYLQPASGGSYVLVAGDSVSSPEHLSFYGSKFELTVDAIDPVARAATITTTVTPPVIPHEVLVERGPFRTPWIAWTTAEREQLATAIEQSAFRVDRFEDHAGGVADAFPIDD